ncbi:hypothetical protein BK784_21220 [Bacillus thuringiensis serovar medellin]|uniref:Uncharacterized protein n=2 Tax=Bacillus thuringiensis TaxID=1428 RepID=A0A9X6REG2_BACTV|nr:hypothetical protein [Bacillus thuringiensis]OUB94141.1 hypothetical protein BK784_21220 [Bacillus thuringiensis serovar medellin]
MKNKKVMKKIIDLNTQYLATREQSRRVMVQSYIISKAFGVKNDETSKPVKDYERAIVLSDNEIKVDFNNYLSLLNWAKEINDMDKAKEFEDRINYFIEAVRFLNDNLADKFKKLLSMEK